MTNPTNPPAQPIQRRSDGKVFVFAEVLPNGEVHVDPDLLATVLGLAGIDFPGGGGPFNGNGNGDNDHGDGYGEDFEDSQESAEYARALNVVFPVDIQDEFAAEHIRIPIRKILDWAAAAVPRYAETLKKIRREYYDGDLVEDYELELKEKVYETSAPTAEELSIKRVARAAGRLSRDAQKAAIEASMEDDDVREQKWILDQAEGRSTPFDKYMEDQTKDNEYIGKMARRLNAASDAFVLERVHNKDTGFAARNRAKLATMQRRIDREIEVRSKATDAALKARKKELKAANSAAEKRSAS